jgi:hypothetical protein
MRARASITARFGYPPGVTSVRIRADVPAFFNRTAVNDAALRERENDHRMALVHEH